MQLSKIDIDAASRLISAATGDPLSITANPIYALDNYNIHTDLLTALLADTPDLLCREPCDSDTLEDLMHRDTLLTKLQLYINVRGKMVHLLCRDYRYLVPMFPEHETAYVTNLYERSLLVVKPYTDEIGRRMAHLPPLHLVVPGNITPEDYPIQPLPLPK